MLSIMDLIQQQQPTSGFNQNTTTGIMGLGAPVAGEATSGMNQGVISNAISPMENSEDEAWNDMLTRMKAAADAKASKQRQQQWMNQNPGTGMANTFAGAPPVQQAPSMAGLMAMVNQGGR